MQDAGSFFANEPIVIDASKLNASPDWATLLPAFTHHNLPVLGVYASGAILEAAQAAGLVSIELASPKHTESQPGDLATDLTDHTPAAKDLLAENAKNQINKASEANEPIEAKTTQNSTDGLAATATPLQVAAQTMVIHGPLRSGQRIYARHADLIVMGLVSPGAEVIADGNIHIYGPLRGKAMAGARGQTEARIFTTSLDAELVAIAGVYRVIEGVLPTSVHRKPSMIHLENEALTIEPLSG